MSSMIIVRRKFSSHMLLKYLLELIYHFKIKKNMLSEISYGKHIQGEIVDFTQHECGGCGIPFFVPTKWINNKIQQHGSFHCPNGCRRVFSGKTEAEKLKEKLALLQQEKNATEQKLQDQFLDALNEKKKLERKLK